MVLSKPQSESSHVMCPVHRLREALVSMNAALGSENQIIPVTTMILIEATLSKEFREFLETIQRQGT